MRLPSPEQVDRILAFRGAFDDPEASHSVTEWNPDTMPFAWNSESLERLIQALYEGGFVLTGFDWCDWKEGLARWDDIEWIATVDYPTLCKLFTAHLRNDRGVQGHLAEMCRQGVVRALLERLAVLRELDECG